MGRKKPLSDFEKGQIAAFNKAGLSSRNIARQIGRSPHVVNNFLHLGSKYGKKKSTGRPRKLTMRQERLVVKKLKVGETLTRLSREPTINVHKSTLSRVLRRNEHLVYKKKKTQPRLTELHKRKRMEWAKEHMTWKEQWLQVVFSDEKKFNLDGPDGWAYYWRDLRNEESIFSKRQCGGGSLMVWAGFGSAGRTNIAFPTGRMKAEDYQDMLEENLLPFGENIGGTFWKFQQDNASIHVANSSWEWFLDNGVQVINWPACSPDLNPIENVWGILSRAVYANGKQYANAQELKDAIVTEWENINSDVLKRLVESMPDRIFEVIAKKGSFTRY